MPTCWPIRVLSSIQASERLGFDIDRRRCFWQATGLCSWRNLTGPAVWFPYQHRASMKRLISAPRRLLLMAATVATSWPDVVAGVCRQDAGRHQATRPTDLRRQPQVWPASPPTDSAGNGRDWIGRDVCAVGGAGAERRPAKSMDSSLTPPAVPFCSQVRSTSCPNLPPGHDARRSLWA